LVIETVYAMMHCQKNVKVEIKSPVLYQRINSALRHAMRFRKLKIRSKQWRMKQRCPYRHKEEFSVVTEL